MYRTRGKPHHLLAHEALFRRLKRKYKYNETAQTHYQNYRAGYLGERNVDYKLSLLPNNFIHLPSLRLKNRLHFFQMDSVILTPKLIFLLEIKNLRGTIEYRADSEQLIQFADGKEVCFQSPILQVELQKRHLAEWLRQYGVTVPIETFVVSANPHTIIRNIDNNKLFHERFIALDRLLFKLEEMYETYEKTVFTYRELHTFYKHLVQNDLPLKADLISFYNLESRHFIKGIPCEKCEFFPLDRRAGHWSCPKCGHKDLTGHERVILDYFLLYDDKISNRICRSLLETVDENTVYRLLRSMNLRKIGGNKNREYLAPNLDEFPQDAVPKQFEVSIFG